MSINVHRAKCDIHGRDCDHGKIYAISIRLGKVFIWLETGHSYVMLINSI